METALRGQMRSGAISAQYKDLVFNWFPARQKMVQFCYTEANATNRHCDITFDLPVRKR